MKRLLVPHDSSQLANVAFEIAMNLASKLHAEMFLLTIIGPKISTAGMSSRMARDKLDEIDAKARSFLTRLKDYKSKNAKIRIDTIRDPSASRGINRFANANDIDLIVIASRGHSGLKKIILGNVASKVIKNAKCPVLIAKKQQTKLNRKTTKKPSNK